MPLKTQFQIVESSTEISEPITKFGGQPVWIAQPLWPLAPETGEQMMFLGQISLDKKLFPQCPNGTMVYLFFSGESEPLYNEAIATVIQTPENVHTIGASKIDFVPEATGSAIFEWDENNQAIYKEYRVVLNPIEDEDSIPLEDRYMRKDLNYETGYHFSKSEYAGNKIGGQPLCIQRLITLPEPFNSEEWLLLLQLAPTQGYYESNMQPNFYPFYMELGEFGILTVFISKDYTQTICYIQQP